MARVLQAMNTGKWGGPTPRLAVGDLVKPLLTSAAECHACARCHKKRQPPELALICHMMLRGPASLNG